MQNLMALLLAGGKGTRMQGLTFDVPKPLVPYAAQCRMIDYSLKNCLESGVNEVLLMSQFEERQVHRYLLDNWCDKLNIHFGHFNDIKQDKSDSLYDLVEKPVEQGTADALITNRTFIDTDNVEHVMVLHADHIYNLDFSEMYKQHLATGAALTLGYQSIPLDQVRHFGMVSFNDNNQLTAFEEKPHKPTSNKVFTAVCIFNKSIMYEYLDDLKTTDWRHDISYDLIPAMLSNRELILGYEFADYWEDIGTPERFYKAHMRFAKGTHQLNSPQTLISDSVVRRFTSANFNRVVMPTALSEQSFYAEDSVIFPGVKIPETCTIIRSVILPGAKIPNGSVIEDAIVNGAGISVMGDYIQSDEVHIS